MKRILILGLMALALVVFASNVKADPWPNLSAYAGDLSYLHVAAAESLSGDGIWKFTVTVDGGAPIDPTLGGVKALAIYLPNDPRLDLAYGGWGGGPPSLLAYLSGWGYNGGYEANKGLGFDAFGFVGNSPANYIHKGQSLVVGRVDFSLASYTFDPNTVRYLLHRDDGYGNTAWYGPGGQPVIPEPATLLLLGSGLLGAAGFTRLRRKK